MLIMSCQADQSAVGGAAAVDPSEAKVQGRQADVLKSVLHKLWANKDLTYRKGSRYDTPEHRVYALAMYNVFQEALRYWGWELTTERAALGISFSAWLEDETTTGTACMLDT